MPRKYHKVIKYPGLFRCRCREGCTAMLAAHSEQTKFFAVGHYKHKFTEERNRNLSRVLKGVKKSKTHIENARQGLLRYFANHKGHPCKNRGKFALTDKKIAFQSFRCRLIPKNKCEILVEKMFSIDNIKKRKKFFDSTKDSNSKNYIEGRKLTEDQKEHLSKINIGKKYGPISKEVKIKMRNAAHRNLQSGRTKPSANAIRGYFYSKKNNQKMKYRSLWERTFMMSLENASNVIYYTVEPLTIRYIFNGIESIYFPDFKLIGKSRNTLVEVKPKGLLKDKRVIAKLKAAKKFCKNNNYEFAVITEDELFGGANQISGLC